MDRDAGLLRTLKKTRSICRPALRQLVMSLSLAEQIAALHLTLRRCLLNISRQYRLRIASRSLRQLGLVSDSRIETGRRPSALPIAARRRNAAGIIYQDAGASLEPDAWRLDHATLGSFGTGKSREETTQ